VRLVQIDTPEVHFGTECYGEQVSAVAKRLLPPGTLVRLTLEPATDRIDRGDLSVPTDLPIGSELIGYRMEDVLGRGGMGIVYLAEDLRLKRRVALKLLSPQLAKDEQFRERLLAESRIAASLDHPNIIPIYEAGEVQGQIFISMRYVEGSDLKAPRIRTGDDATVRRARR
jgi:serine/threonine protein kinase